MRGLKDMLLAEKARLEKIVQVTESRLKDAEEGSLRLSRSQNCTQFYYCTEEHKKGVYLSKSKEGLIRRLAQKSYDEKVFRLAMKRLGQIERIVRDYEDDEIVNIYRKEHPERQKFVQPVEISWEQKFEKWKSEPYKGKEFYGENPVILTEQGERVRSKSEKIMADYFFRNGIEYKYECPLYLKGVGTIYPDFTFLSPKNGVEIYWEHQGRMDDPGYVQKAVRKILSYEKHGIFVGERLILTYETEQIILNTDKIEQLVRKYLV